MQNSNSLTNLLSRLYSQSAAVRHLVAKRSVIAAGLIAAVLLAVAAQPAFAQQEEEDGVRYIVQAGDTLSSISLRFDVSIQDIISASKLTNPNALNVGDVLIIPGLDWIEGTLSFLDVPLGENFVSLKRRYLLSSEGMARLNQLTSPDQMYYGFPAMLTTQHGELTGRGRALVAAGQSLWELAAISGDNPWALMGYNQLPGAWAVPGDVLFTPGVQAAGPGGLPNGVQGIEVQGQGFVQGRTLVLAATADPEVVLGGEFFGHALNFFAEGETQQVALQGVPLEAESGTYDFVLSGTLADGSPFSFSQPVRVASGGYASESLTVDLQFLDPEQNASELQWEQELTTPASGERRWAGYWGAPHPYINVINSDFGIHRTYNKGVYENYHRGTDFGGGVGIEIWAPAPGRVVYAGETVIHGNFTVIDHGRGVYTTYSHQSQLLVAEGDEVQTGQVIGLVGATGRITGAHLHWEVWVGGTAVEPMDWLNYIYP
ncbi:MAG: peptidoglycan DD-metalloendopeptidase family protein [Anaerolineales bacterium]|nr:peptidoglycan DD-metalloendopeptidase family protein [Anaerolineales bacterium]